MKTKTKSLIAVILAVAVGYVLSHPIVFHICSTTYQFNDYIGCLDGSIKNIGSPLLIFSSWMLFVVIAASFFSEKIFQSWLKLAAWTLPLLFIFVATQPVVASFLSTNRDDAARLAAEIFTVLSLVLILWNLSTARRKDSAKV